MVKGLAAEREFTAIGRDRRLRVRPPDLEQGIEQLSRVAAGTIDTITLNMVMRRWARAVLDRMVATFAARGSTRSSWAGSGVRRA
jgi:citrate lyase beta subunit